MLRRCRCVLRPVRPALAAALAALLLGCEHTPAGPRRVVTVFMPTTPNPTTGFFLVYPAASVKETDLSVEEALRMVISGGLVSATQERLFPRPTPRDAVP